MRAKTNGIAVNESDFAIRQANLGSFFGGLSPTEVYLFVEIIKMHL